MEIFILSFLLIFIIMLGMAIGVLSGKTGIKGGCSGTIIEGDDIEECQQCDCKRINTD